VVYLSSLLGEQWQMSHRSHPRPYVPKSNRATGSALCLVERISYRRTSFGSGVQEPAGHVGAEVTYRVSQGRVRIVPPDGESHLRPYVPKSDLAVGSRSVLDSAADRAP
jgi:hypothetical protein